MDESNPTMYPGTVPSGEQAESIDPPHGYAAMPASAPDPIGGENAPVGNVPPMRTPDTSARFDPWNYREDTELGDGANVVGYRVEAADGHIGKVDEATTNVDGSYLVVDTGPWIFGKKVLLPAGVINRIDYDDEKVYVSRTKDQIKNAPEFDPEQYATPEYREKVGTYFDGTYSAVPGATGYAGSLVPPLNADAAGALPPEQPRDPNP